MEGLFAVLGISALVVTLILPICTFVIVRGMSRRMESLEQALRAHSREASRPASDPAAPPPAAQTMHPAPVAFAETAAQPPVARPAPPAAVPVTEPVAMPPVARPIYPAAAPVAEPVKEPLPTFSPTPDVVPLVAVPAAPPPLSPRSAASARLPDAVPPQRTDSDAAAVRLLRRMWNWIAVGEEHRKPGVSAEYAIATTWLIRAFVVITVFAVGFGLQLSISRGLLGPSGRVALALVSGAAFIVTGLLCTGKRYRMLGQGFIGGGLAMFYFAFYASAAMFHLMSITSSFACMAVVTASAVVLAVRLEALSIAVLGVLGGYATPLVLKTAHPDLSAFYAYLAVLALGMAVVAMRRQWPLLTWLSLALNSALFLYSVGDRFMWRVGNGTAEEIAYLCGFFAIFSTAIFAYAARKKVSVTTVEISALFLNALVTVGGGTLLIGYGPEQRVRLAVLALGIAAFYVGHIWFFLLRRSTDRALLSGFIALAVIFLGLALPLLFTGHVLSTMFALQAVALLWIGRRLDSRMFTRGAFFCYAIVLARLSAGLLDRSMFDQIGAASYWAGLKDRVAEFVVPIVTLFGGWHLFRTPPPAAQQGVGDPDMRGAGAFQGALFFFAAAFYIGLVAYVTCELFAFTSAFIPAVKMAAVTVVWSLFVFHLLAVRSRLSVSVFHLLLWLSVIFVGGQWLLGGWLFGQAPVLEQLRHAAPFSADTVLPRLAATVACLAVLVGARRSLGADGAGSVGFKQVLMGAALVTGFLYMTFETATCCTAYLPGFRSGAVSVVWGGYALSLVVCGLRFRRHELRMLGLALFFVTVGKVFLVDLAGSVALYRLMAFGMLGGVLLLAAYAYLRNQDAFNKSAGDGQEGK